MDNQFLIVYFSKMRWTLFHPAGSYNWTFIKKKKKNVAGNKVTGKNSQFPVGKKYRKKSQLIYSGQ